MAENTRETELILAPGVFAFVLDQTKGKVNTLSGPIKSSLSNTDQPVVYDTEKKRFVPAALSSAIQTNVTAVKGHYVVLENPAKDGKQPEPGKLEDMSLSALKMGQTENISGPVSFPLWPGQNATVIRGHHLRSNQYLLVRVYDDEAARSNWDKSIVKEVSGTESKSMLSVEDLVTGQLQVIRGTEVAFYIPPTGIEVLKEDNEYVRDAVTLEVMEYSILLDENGKKEYVRGPAVVFPKPTQKFLSSGNGSKKFRAYELQPKQGLHLKVLTDYQEDSKQYRTGDELFLTGDEQSIYFPRPEHAIISYSGGDRHFAIAIPSGEARYVLDRNTGSIDLVKGPEMFLANPIHQVMVRRILTEGECKRWYPGNEEVLDVNRTLAAENASSGAAKTKSGIPIVPAQNTSDFGAWEKKVMEQAPQANAPKVADRIQRASTHTPRSITIDSKYQGAPKVKVWSGYAVQVVNSKGERRTLRGPQTLLLEYDEYLETLSFSTGTPKRTDTLIDTVYLKHTSNPVSDKLILKTQDLVNVQVLVKYQVRFDEKSIDDWFAVGNYIQHLVDHLRSLMGNAVRRIGIQDLYHNAADVLRDVVLGPKKDDEGRALRSFAENGMVVYDMELLSVEVLDEEMATLLTRSKQEALSDSIELERQIKKLELTKGQESARRQREQEIASTSELLDKLALDQQSRKAHLALQVVQDEQELEAARRQGEQTSRKIILETEAFNLEARSAQKELEEKWLEAELVRKIKLLVEEANSKKTELEAIQPRFVEALVAASNAGILERVTPSLSALAFTNNRDLENVLSTMFKGTAAESLLPNLRELSTKGGNKK